MNPHLEPRVSPGEMVASLWRSRTLVRQLVRSDVLGRYKGSLMGIAWSFFNPLLMLTIYTFVFSIVFNSRWAMPGLANNRFAFALVLFVGLIFHGLLSECISRAPGLIINNANYVKKVVFPLEVLAWVALSSAHFHALISLLVLFCAQLVIMHMLPWTVVLLPLIVVPFALMTLGITWMISATGVYLRDIAQVTGIVSSALMFLAPVFYPLSSLPEEYRSWLYLNPLTFPIEQARSVLINAELPDWVGLGWYALVSILVACMGFWCFQRARRGFSDVL